MNSTLILFGASKRWVPPPWTTTDDRVRGGASQSYLTALPDNCARFHGHLDTSTLGGAGFASQFSPLDAAGAGDGERRDGWDLSAYDGIEVAVGKGDGKVYTLILKDDVPVEKRQDGREKAGVNWEVEFDVAVKGGEETSAEESEDTRVWVPWGDFMATYRGKAKEDAGDIKTGQIRRVGLMMRSYFGKQDGDFSQDLQSISARKYVAGDKQRTMSGHKKVSDNIRVDVGMLVLPLLHNFLEDFRSNVPESISRNKARTRHSFTTVGSFPTNEFDLIFKQNRSDIWRKPLRVLQPKPQSVKAIRTILIIHIIAKKYNRITAPIVRRWPTAKLPNITTTQVVVPELEYTT